MLTDVDALSAEPNESVTVSTTLNVPVLLYDLLGTLVVALVPSPKSQKNVSVSFSAPGMFRSVDVLVNVMLVSVVVLFVEAVKLATGG